MQVPPQEDDSGLFRGIFSTVDSLAHPQRKRSVIPPVCAVAPFLQ